MLKPEEKIQITAALLLAALPKETLGHVCITLAEKLEGVMSRDRALTGKLPFPAEFKGAIASRFILLAARDNGVDVQVSEHGPENSGAEAPKPAPEKQPEPAPEQEPSAEQVKAAGELAEKILSQFFRTPK